MKLASAVLAAVLLMVPGLVKPAAAQIGGISVTPNWIIFEGRQRSAEVSLINTTNKAITYRVMLENKRMTDDGNLEAATKPRPGEHFADKMIRYSPRQVTIPPQSSQSIRLLVRKSRKLPEGEYRTHLFMQSLPPAEEVGSDIASTLNKGELAIKFIPILGISIPIIIRHGKLKVSAKITDVAIKPPKDPKDPEDFPHLNFRLHREGDRSFYGKLDVVFKPRGGKETHIGLLNGVAVYTPNESRTVDIPVFPPEGMKLKNGTLELILHEVKGKKEGPLLARATKELS